MQWRHFDIFGLFHFINIPAISANQQESEDDIDRILLPGGQDKKSTTFFEIFLFLLRFSPTTDFS